jgi:small-conductance mechanosensitive channel
METVLQFLRDLGPALTSSDVRKTALLAITILGARFLVNRAVNRATRTAHTDERARALVAVRNIAVVLFLAGLIAIWAEELQSVLLSLVALATAMVFAFKEIINAVSGAVVRTTNNAFHIGDRIEINGHRGDVIDYSLLTTTLLEVGPGQNSHQYTGRAVIVPNSWLLTYATVNETFTDAYLLHQFQVTIHRNDDWKAAEGALLESANAECAPFLEEARRYLDQMARRHNFEPMAVDPRILVRLPDPAKIELLLRVPVPARQKGRIEQAIVRRFLEATRVG